MPDIQSKTLTDIVFEKLEAAILSGAYSRGDMLTELKLSAELNVSRTPIREAIRRLEQEQLVRESGKGVEVIGIDINDILDIYEIRMKIEGSATAKCAEKISEEQFKVLEDLLELQEFYTLKSSVDGIKETDSGFHEKIYEYCGSGIYSSVLVPLHRKAQKFRKLSVENSDRAKTAVKEHREILDALRSHNSKLAEALAVNHIKNARDNILAELKVN